MLTLFQKLGTEAEERFAAADNSPSAFNGIAGSLLDEWDLCRHVSLEGVWQAAGLEQLDSLGNQSSPGLIPLYSGTNVRIIAHLWSDAADRLHQHDWTGAFQVIEGQSFNSVFDFETVRDIEEFSTGKLSRRSFEVFDAGHIKPVQEGRSLIHSVVYCGKPGLAISLRVAGEGQFGAYEYLRPGLRCPSYRRRSASAAQLDLLTQALQVDMAVYEEKFTALVEKLDEGAIIRLLDAAAFDSLPVPETVIEVAAERLPDGAQIIASLDDIERSDKTRELLGEHDHPKIRKFICALFHSESRSELNETLQIAGFANPVIDSGRALSSLIIDDEAGELPPDYLVQALGDAMMTGDVPIAIATMRTQAADAPLLDSHCQFVGEAFEAMKEAPVFRCLFKA